MSKLAVVNEYDRCNKCRGCVVSCQRNFLNSSLGRALDPGTGSGLGVTTTAGRISADEVTVVKPQFAFDFPPFMKYNCWHCANPPCGGRCPFRAISKKTDGSVVVDFNLCRPTRCNQECVMDCGHGGYPKVGQGNGVDLKAYKCDMCNGRRIPLLINNGGVIVRNVDVIDMRTFGSFKTEARTTNNLADIDKYKVPACVLACTAGALKIGYLSDVDAHMAPYSYKHGLTGDSWRWAGNLMAAPPTSDPLLDDHLVPLTHHLVEGKLVPVGLLIGGLYLLYKRRREVAEEAVKG